MEENYEKRKSKLPLLIGILSLILVLSVGGVYAYFSARATNSGSEITGRTLDINGSTLAIAATRVDLDPDPEPVSDNLVPANFGVAPTEVTTTQVNRALDRECAGGGYTGCHVWKITATTTQNIPSANIRLNLSLSNVEYEDEWSYVVYTGTDTSSSTIINKGNIATTFPNANTTIDIHNGASLTAGTPAIYYVMVYLNNTNIVQNDGINDNTTDERGTYNGTVILEAMGGEVYVSFVPTAAEYITSLYTNANKSTATVNNITYNLAPSVNLMNDRHASMSTDINGGDIRYYGANPNNYVWLGDTYTSNYTFTLDGNTITRNAGEKKLWRIVGVFDGKLKLIQNDPISNEELSWDVSLNNINYGFGVNQWGQSGNYEGAALMRLLNPVNDGFEGKCFTRETDVEYCYRLSDSLYWNKGTGTVYTGSTNATVSFANTGLSNAEKNMIDTATWYTGAIIVDWSAYIDAYYNAERGNIGKLCNVDEGCNDTVTRTSTWNGKVGLMYASDYGYASDLSECDALIESYSEDGACRGVNWLTSSQGKWTISPVADYYESFQVHYVGFGILGEFAVSTFSVYPSIYLKSNVTIDTNGNDGSFEYPYVLS